MSTHCGVSEISLPSTDGQLVAHVVHGGVGHAQVALAVLKVDGRSDKQVDDIANVVNFEFLRAGAAATDLSYSTAGGS
eukprot:1154237-Pelagomonas_calceolata.AAC.5